MEIEGGVDVESSRPKQKSCLHTTAQCAFWVLRLPCGQNGPVYATGPYYVAHVVDTGP